jgi:hypothetical protein
MRTEIGLHPDLGQHRQAQRRIGARLVAAERTPAPMLAEAGSV